MKRKEKEKISNFYNFSAFTLLELLIVIGILSTLATIAILVLNPAELLKQSRDAKRLSEIQTIDDAIRFYTFNSGTLYYGTSSVVYLSLPDSNATCSSYSNLPTLTGGWTYACKPESTYRKVDGTGWIPVNFLSTQAGSSLAILPVDPVNNNTYYYAYIPGSWVLTVKIESVKYLPTAQNDGGSDTARFEIGSNLALWSTSGAGSTSTTPWALPTSGLVSHWKFDNNSNDDTGTYNFNSGSLTYDTVVKKEGTHSFSGAYGYNTGGSESLFDLQSDFSISAWVYRNVGSGSGYMAILAKVSGSGTDGWYLRRLVDSQNGNICLEGGNASSQYRAVCTTTQVVPEAVWVHIVLTRSGSTYTFYINGSYNSSATISDNWYNNNYSLYLARLGTYSGYYWSGRLDDIAFYSRALTSTEITDIYTHTQ